MDNSLKIHTAFYRHSKLHQHKRQKQRKFKREILEKLLHVRNTTQNEVIFSFHVSPRFFLFFSSQQRHNGHAKTAFFSLNLICYSLVPFKKSIWKRQTTQGDIGQPAYFLNWRNGYAWIPKKHFFQNKSSLEEYQENISRVSMMILKFSCIE